MACQVSGAVVSAVSAMTIELGKRLAPVIVEKGGKVCLTSCLLLLLFSLNVVSSTNSLGFDDGAPLHCRTRLQILASRQWSRYLRAKNCYFKMIIL